MRFGGGSAFSEARVRGQLYGQPLGQGALRFSVVQTYDYQNNAAYATGSQSIEPKEMTRRMFTAAVSVQQATGHRLVLSKGSLLRTGSGPEIRGWHIDTTGAS